LQNQVKTKLETMQAMDSIKKEVAEITIKVNQLVE